jgi:hypothetical protein
MSASAGNDASGASGTGPTSGYSLIFLYFIGFIVKFILTLNTCTYLVSLFIVIKLLINCMRNYRPLHLIFPLASSGFMSDESTKTGEIDLEHTQPHRLGLVDETPLGPRPAAFRPQAPWPAAGGRGWRGVLGPAAWRPWRPRAAAGGRRCLGQRSGGCLSRQREGCRRPVGGAEATGSGR